MKVQNGRDVNKLVRIVSFLVAIMISNCCNAAMHVWKSGAIQLPDGTVAGEGDVIGYARITYGVGGLDALERDRMYSELVWDGRLKDINATWIVSELSDNNGEVNIPDNVSWGLPNTYATVLYICVYDGYEYYKEVFGHYNDGTTSGYKEYNDHDLAALKEWQKGEVVGTTFYGNTPEPSSSVLVLMGLSHLLLKRGSKKYKRGSIT